jgi:uncharacterized surface protein with fasciclin (FAS1) repeats
MRSRHLASLALGLILGFASYSPASDQKSIYENIEASSNHTILLSAIAEARQVMILNAKGANTFFAPNDEAFKKLSEVELKKLIENKELLKKIVLAHLVTEKAITSQDLKKMVGKEINGFAISDSDGLKIGDAKVKQADLKCSNGIIHVIDTVLIPK